MHNLQAVVRALFLPELQHVLDSRKIGPAEKAREEVLASRSERTPAQQPMRGLACAVAERAQDAAYLSLDPTGEGFLFLRQRSPR